jgi:hypothetical protein
VEDAALIVLGVLPVRARQKLAKLQAARDDARALLATLSERRKAVDNALMIAVQNLTAGPPPGNPRDAATRGRLEAEVAAAQDQINEIERAQRARQSALHVADHVLPPIEGWLRNVCDGPVDLSGGSHFVDVVIDPATIMESGETFEAAVARTRNEIYRLGAEMRTIHDAPRPAKEIKAALIAAIDGLAAAGRPTLDLAAGQVRVTWPDGYAMGSGIQPLAASKLICWLLHDEVVAAVTAGVDKMTGGIPVEGRAERVAGIARRIRRLEFEEEILIDSAAAEGVVIDRRGGVPPEVILLIHPKVLAGDLGASPSRPAAIAAE